MVISKALHMCFVMTSSNQRRELRLPDVVAVLVFFASVPLWACAIVSGAVATPLVP
jgi:hypothetical protein